MDAPETLQQAIAMFSDPDTAFQAAVEFRWLGGNVTCPRCGGAKHSFVKTRKLWFCYDCKKQFTVKVGTIMEDSPIGVDKWMTAMWMLANCKNGISSYELAKNIGVRQNTAWFMLHRIREAMRDERTHKFGFGGPVESDEAFIGPNPTKMNRKQRQKYSIKRGKIGNDGGMIAKTAVHGILDRHYRQVRAKVVSNVRREVLQSAILDNVTPFAKVYTDEATAYQGLEKKFVHKVINHSQEYVRGQVHTQGIENFWSLLKRTLRGTYVAVEPFHLDQYLAEQCFRYNNRATKDNKLTDSDRFACVMAQVGGRRLTYAELTGKDSNEPHKPEAGTGQTEPF